MASESTTTPSRSLFPWGARAGFALGKTRKHRQVQYRHQVNMLIIAVVLAVGAAALLSLYNYSNIGSTKTVSCEEYPEFCVPLAGGASSDALVASLESPDSRELDAESTGVPGVVRYMDDVDDAYTATLGDPSAPIHFVVTSDFACPHCQKFHQGDLTRIIDDLVLTGQATFGHMMLTGTGGAYSELASQAALCAGEQGAFWEFGDELFRLAESQGVQSAFALTTIRDSAKGMGLDADELVSCVNTRRYSTWMPQYSLFAQDHGVTGTPTVLVSYGDTGTWTIVPNRSYDYIAALVETANAQ